MIDNLINSEHDTLSHRFLDACLIGDRFRVDALLRAGVDIDVRDDDYVTGLQFASAAGHTHIVQLLLNRNANINACNQVGMTAFLHACRHGRIDIVRMLMRRGADIHCFTYTGATALCLATAGGHRETVELLLNHGANVNSTTSGYAPTPLMTAALYGHTDMCQLLTNRGANINAQSVPLGGLNALALVALCGTTSIAQTLLDNGADPNLQTANNGKNAYELAKKWNRFEMMNTLEAYSNDLVHDNNCLIESSSAAASSCALFENTTADVFYKNTQEEVHKILNHLQLSDMYGAIFAEQEVDMETFLTLTDIDLHDSLGIRAISVRKKILSAVDRLKEQFASNSWIVSDALIV